MAIKHAAVDPAAPSISGLWRELTSWMPRGRVINDPLRLLAWGTDASFYRLVPQLVVVVESEAEVQRVLHCCARAGTPVTFRAAGTSLSGQAVTDSVLVLLGDGWRQIQVAQDAATITLGPGVIGAAANRALAPFGRKIGPDPASIDAAKIGGIAANNAGGMCCGTAQNSYRTLAGLRLVLADGSVLDTRDPASRSAIARTRADLVQGLAELAREVRADAELAARIRHKFRLKNTTGYSLNALVDFEDPIDVLAHLVIGSEGTLAFISEICLETVPDHAHKASALLLFEHLETACRAVSALKASPVAAVELLDRASLRSVQDQPGLPEALKTLPGDAAALLLEVRGETAAALELRLAAVQACLQGLPTVTPLHFTSDALAAQAMWNVRKGIFPAIGAMRPVGTTVIIEDVAFPVERLAAATLDLQHLLRDHGYAEAVVYGHALDGNLHFVFTQDFGRTEEVERYRRLMDAVCDLVVQRYDGSLKAEHGTGRNMAPFVEREWGAQATAVMRRIKALFDPSGLLNPGVILNEDPQVHLKNLKPLPATNSFVDPCIECGFCEPKCPSHGLTLSPRQRIVGWREIARLQAQGQDEARLAEMQELYDHHGIETCAACGLCATACPVHLETGVLIKSLRARRAGPLARKVADTAAHHYAALTTGVRLGLGLADVAHGVLGSDLMKGSLDGLRRASGGRLPKWSPALARPVHFVPRPKVPTRAERLVCFPSCATRNMGAQRGDAQTTPLPDTAERLFERGGFDVIYPHGLAGLCCGQPFESQGLMDAADHKARELEAALSRASEGGRWPIVFDTSPCSWRMRKFMGARLPVLDSIEFLHDHLMPRLRFQALDESVAVHPVCSVRKMGSSDKLLALARRCSTRVVSVDEVQCCGFAGERGFNRPELNEHALRHLKAALPADCTQGCSSSRTCEIGLSEMSGVPYRSILALVERCTRTAHSNAGEIASAPRTPHGADS